MNNSEIMSVCPIKGERQLYKDKDKYNRHLTVKSICWYFNEKSSDVLIYDYRKLKVIKRLICKIAILHHNITILHDMCKYDVVYGDNTF